MKRALSGLATPLKTADSACSKAPGVALFDIKSCVLSKFSIIKPRSRSNQAKYKRNNRSIREISLHRIDDFLSGGNNAMAIYRRRDHVRGGAHYSV